MKEPYSEGLASHTGPESCVGAREDTDEALTGVRTGQPLSGELDSFGTPTLLSEAEGNTGGDVMREPSSGPAPSETLCTCGNSLHGNREIPGIPPLDGRDGRSGKAESRKPDTYVPGKSDGCIVPRRPPNKDKRNLSAEAEEGRRSTKGNAKQMATPRTQSRKSVPPGLQRVRKVAEEDKAVRFTALLHHVTPEALKASFFALKRQAAPGVDGVTWKQYGKGLGKRIENLHARVHNGTYRAQPSKRVYIPKPDGRMRPLGMAALEDKIVQHAVGKVLSIVYEEDFLGFSYGFRPGRAQHDALDALAIGLGRRKVNWVLDADIRGFFDTISHEWMVRFIEHRIADRRVTRLIRKWLRAGVSEDGKWSKTEVGTPQGAVISPLLANIYLHYVLDQWAHHWRRKYAGGDVIIVRYADDFVVGFQHRHEAEQFLAGLHVRLERFGLALNLDKTRLIEFGRFAGENRRKRGQGKPETIVFLGFTHYCTRTRKEGWFHLGRKTTTKRLRATLARIKTALRKRMHAPIPEVGEWLRQVVLGYYQYHAIPGNWSALNAFRREVARNWLTTLRRRGQKRRMNWKRFSPIVKRWLPEPVLLHPHPNVRFDAKHPR